MHRVQRGLVQDGAAALILGYQLIGDLLHIC